MTKGFPKHITELAQRAAGHINLADVFNHPDGDTLFVDTRNTLHDITLHTKRTLSIEEAFNEVLGASWGNVLGLPVAPVLFDYQPVDDQNRHEENGYGSFITSVQMHSHTVRVETVLEHAQARDKAKPYAGHSFDATMWESITHTIDVPSLLVMEAAVFDHAIKPMSALLPYMEWIGCSDLNPGNQLLDMRKALNLVQDHGDAQGNDLGFYLCDFSANILEASGLEYMSAQEIAGIDTRSPVGALSALVEFYPSLKAAEIKLTRAAKVDDREWYSLGAGYPEKLIVPVFAPHLDFPSMRATILHIQSLDDETIRAEMKRLATTMSHIIPDKKIIRRLMVYADYMAEAFIVRRDRLVHLVDTQLSHEAHPHPRTSNPFAVFKDVIKEEADAYREKFRIFGRVKRPAKPAAKPKDDKKHEP